MNEDNDDPDFGWVDGDVAEETEAQPAQAPPTAAAQPRPQRARASRGRYRRRRAVAVTMLVLVGFAAWFAWELFQPFAGSGSGNVTVSIAHGDGSSQIASELAADHVVASSFFFKLRIALDGDGSKFHAGVYMLRRNMSYSAALALLTQPPKQVSVVIPEGFTRAQIAVRAAAAGLTGDYLTASRPSAALRPQTYGAPASVKSLEGFLFPATYFDFQHGSVSALVAQQLQAFQQNFDQLNFAHAEADHLTRYQVLIIASMIEREAQVPSDRALVSAVIYNRLHDGMPLGIDATLRYALNDFTQPLTASQLALDSPYNTRIHTGLPPTPISNPGVASMIAAAAPASVSYLYYVDKPNTCGKLAFATTYSQFQTEVAAYNTARTANGGRAPTKCP
ncbi:MAG TPA: endolytic transglycosylase MltG [Solirubrobacteraceae bacterium]|nr:endolytic transglycosylase MltG [Solirubrobacteraceae bacterium]